MRNFEILRRGYIRDNIVLSYYRNALKAKINPQTGTLYTEDEIRRGTAPGTYYYIQADAIDLLGQANQAKGLLLANQQRPCDANSSSLENIHGRLWLGKDSKLPAVGGSGTVDAPAQKETVFAGSYTLGDPDAVVGTDPSGKRYQVLETVQMLEAGTAELTLKGIDVGADTNPANGTKITWSQNKPLGAEAEATVACPDDDGFTGGFEQETDADYASRIESIIVHRPGAGNPAHLEAWARESSVAIEAAFIYPCAFHAGSVLVCITQKRGSTPGPYGRSNVSIGTMADATGYLVPPNSPIVPKDVFVVVTEATPQDSDIVIGLDMGQGISGGWEDSVPWPCPDRLVTSYPAVIVKSVTSQTLFKVEADCDLPNSVTQLTGTNAPTLMLWDKGESVFEKLDVAKVEKTATYEFTITLNNAPSMTIEEDQYLSPYTDRCDLIADAISDYFDSLGPGEIVDLATDDRAHRAYRFPPMTERYPCRAGQKVISWITDVLGETAADASLYEISRSEPDLPAQIIHGPNIVTLGHVAVYPM